MKSVGDSRQTAKECAPPECQEHLMDEAAGLICLLMEIKRIHLFTHVAEDFFVSKWETSEQNC